MKANTSGPTSNAFISQKSDLIKAELAKYRLLKSQGSFLGHGETKETTSFPQNNLSTIQSPSGDEASHSSVMALLQLNNSSQTTLGVPKNEYQLNPPNKGVAQPSPSNSNTSSRITRKSFGGVVDERDHAKPDHNTSYSSASASRNYSGSQTPSATNKLPLSKNSFNSVSAKKKTAVGKFASQEEKQLDHLEDMIDAEIEKDLLSKVYPKTTHHTSGSRNLRSATTFVKDQKEAPRRNPSVTEKRTSSAADIIDSDVRNRSSFQHRTKKSSLPDVPAAYLSEDNTPNKASRGLNVSRDFKNSAVKDKKERKTAAPTVGAEPSFKKTVLPGREDEVDGEGDLKEEIEKWRIFGKMMAESYDDLNKKYTDYLKEKEKDKKIISALKDQVNTLKALLKTSKDENARLKDMSTSESWSRAEESKDLKDQKEMAQLTKDMEIIKTESKDTVKMIDMLKGENQNLKKVLEEGQKQKEMTEYYQRLAEVRFKECSALAEEIICLRTDLDRSHSNYLRIQKESSAKKGAGDSFYSGKKMKGGESGMILSNLSSAIKNKNFSEKNVPAWDDESDIPPSPEEYSALPSKEEKLNLRG